MKQKMKAAGKQSALGFQPLARAGRSPLPESGEGWGEGLYIHIPFCRAKCAYCDFVSYPGLDHLHAAYVQAIQREIALRAPAWTKGRFDTLYIGGGTPTLLKAGQIHALIESCRTILGLKEDAEITVEGNPGTVDLAKLQALREAGVNRLSLGVQSLDDGELQLLGRIHSASEAIEAYRLAREAGFANINLDLIFGLPGQRLSRWRETLGKAIALSPEHFSLYALTLEPGTPLAEQVTSGRIPTPSDDTAATMYELAETMLDEGGYEHYEISNWARHTEDALEADGLPALACKHNLKYWCNERYLGLGAGAHSYDGQRRYANIPDPREYIARVTTGEAALAEAEETDRARAMGETMMLGLRLSAGVTWESFARRFGVGLREVYGQEIQALCAQGLLEADEKGIRLTPRGRLLGNRVFAAFLR